MLRYAVLGLIVLTATNALAQQASPPNGAPAASSSQAPGAPPQAVIAMEEPQPATTGPTRSGTKSAGPSGPTAPTSSPR